MKKISRQILKILKNTVKKTLSSGLSAIALAVFAIVLVVYLNKDNKLEWNTNKGINPTPAQIKSIEAIGEWEFLVINDEELIDTVRRSIFGDSELVRIYYGTLRLGINLHKAKPRWLVAKGEKVTATLPAIEMLDENFIDEARTKSFFESGKWTAADCEALYQRAYANMRERCVSPENIETARKNAELQFRNLLQSMGYKEAEIIFEGEKDR